MGALLALLIISRSASAIVIDSFDEGAINLSANAANPFVQGVATGAGIIGGEREVTAIYNPAGSSALDFVDVRTDFANQGNFSHSQDAGVAGLSVIVYDGADGDPSSIDFNGLGGLDLTADGSSAFLFNVLFADQSVSNVLDLRVYSSATAYSDLFYSFPGPISPSSPQQVLFTYANFTQGAGALTGADFTNVGAILLAVDGRLEPALDLRLDSLVTNENPTVPEPATLGLVGLGLSCLGFLKSRKRMLRLA